MTTEHPFAQYIRMLGKGKKGARDLTEQEARDAMGMILREEVEPEQLGAFLMLMRVKEETPAEVAGFVRAVRDTFVLPQPAPRVDLDWSSYAGKRRHLPWFLLAVRLLALNGVRVFMHGTGGHTAGRVYTRDVLSTLGLATSDSLAQAARSLDERGFAYLDLAQLCPRLHAIMELRPLLGLRSPVHTVARMLNPFAAPYVMQGIFHPGYQAIHQGAGVCLGQPHLAVIKGEGGEIERNPDAPCQVYTVHNGETDVEDWPALFAQRHVKPESLDIAQLAALWRGELDDEYAQGAVVGTAALALRLTGRAASPREAVDQALALWQDRPRKLDVS